MPDRQLRILLVGSMPPPLGGGTVMLKHLVDALEARDDVALTVVNTTGIRGRLSGPLRLVATVGRIVRGLRHADAVGLHAAAYGLHIIGPLVAVLACVWRRPLIIRKFGGTDYLQFNALRRMLIRWALKRARLYLPETRATVESARQDGIPRVEWFPNYRPMEPIQPVTDRPPHCRRFVFLSQVRELKGIRELIEAGERFGEDIVVDVYGRFLDGLSPQTFAGLNRVRYCGIVQPERVIGLLRTYDALVLPTYWTGEGYPGIVLEAFSAGLPIITTRWRSVPDLVNETCGLLVEPKNADALYEAMRSLVEDDQLYARLRQGVPNGRQQFDAGALADRFVKRCREFADSTA